jgi:hypothetical protein
MNPALFVTVSCALIFSIAFFERGLTTATVVTPFIGGAMTNIIAIRSGWGFFSIRSLQYQRLWLVAIWAFCNGYMIFRFWENPKVLAIYAVLTILVAAALPMAKLLLVVYAKAKSSLLNDR